MTPPLIVGTPGHYVASPIVAGDKLKILARNAFQKKIHATPAIADNTIYLRTASHVYALGK